MSMMAHRATSMTMMEDPCESLGESVGDVDGASNGKENNDAICFPLLDGKVMDVNVSCAWCRLGCVNNED